MAEVREKYLGRPMERVEDEALLRGLGRYADDYPVRIDTLHAAILRSPHAHAEITAIDTAPALARPGVVAVLTAADVQKYSDPFLNAVKQPMKLWSLAVDRVRFVGEAVAVVVAADRYKAEDALDHIEVDYKPLTPVVAPLDAVRDVRVALAPRGVPHRHEEPAAAMHAARL